MIAVLDASAAVGRVLAMPGTECFDTPLENAALLLAPDLYIAEVCNVFGKYNNSGILTGSHCETALEQALQLPDRVESSSALHLEAFALACRCRHSVYDALYLVLARRNNAVLLTMDRRVAALSRQLEIEVIAVSNERT